MIHSLILRPELPDDFEQIDRLIRVSFECSSVGYHNEAELVRALRNLGDLKLSVVAEVDDQIVGHIAFSPVKFSMDDQFNGHESWFCLAPLAVLPAFQGKMIGQHLVQSGMAGLQKIQASGVIVLGDANYYQRFGFKHIPACTLNQAESEHLLGYSFNARALKGDIILSKGFNVCQ